MNETHQTNDRRRVLLGADGNPISVSPDLTPSAAMGSFHGAEFSRDRGYVYLPTLDSRAEVDQWSRTELTSRAHVLYNSGGGFIHRLVDGISRMVCGTGLMPYPMPVKVRGREEKIKEWSHKVRQLYSQRCGSANTFNLSRRFNTGQAQRATIAAKIKTGDLAWVLARDEETNRLRVMLYEANQIGSGLTESAAGWYDGVKVGRHNEPLAYRILGEDADGKPTQVDIPAQNVLFAINQERIRQTRGLTRFYPVLNKIFDRAEILAAITKGIKVASQPAYAIEQQMQQGPQITPGAPGSTSASGRPTQVVQLGNGRTVTLEKFLGGGEAMELKPGQSFKIVQAESPHENVHRYLNDTIIRDVAFAAGYWPEVCWNIVELGGANMRFVQADTQSQIEYEQEELVDQNLGPHYIAWLRDMIEAGEVEDIDGWELHTWLAPARLTVDFGRDGKLHLEQYKRGHITMKTLYGYRGEEWRAEVDQYLDERQHVVQGVYDRKITVDGVARSMTMEEAYPEIGKQVPPPAADPEVQDEDTEPLPAKRPPPKD